MVNLSYNVNVSIRYKSPDFQLFKNWNRFTASAFSKLPSVYVFSYFPFGFESRMWDLIVSVPDHCLSFYFSIILSAF